MPVMKTKECITLDFSLEILKLYFLKNHDTNLFHTWNNGVC
jgi:hypothetical protein